MASVFEVVEREKRGVVLYGQCKSEDVAGFGFRALVAQDEIRFFDCRGTGILRFRFHNIEFDEDCEDDQGESEDEDRIEKFELFLSRRGPFLFLLFFSVFGEERFEGFEID